MTNHVTYFCNRLTELAYWGITHRLNLFVSRVGSNLCLMNWIRICRQIEPDNPYKPLHLELNEWQGAGFSTFKLLGHQNNPQIYSPSSRFNKQNNLGSKLLTEPNNPFLNPYTSNWTSDKVLDSALSSSLATRTMRKFACHFIAVLKRKSCL